MSAYRHCSEKELLSADLEQPGDHCGRIEKALLRAATSALQQDEVENLPNHHADRLQQLIQKRRTLPHASSERTHLSKTIRQHVEWMKHHNQTKRIEYILDEFRGLKTISRIKTYKKRTMIYSMVV